MKLVTFKKQNQERLGLYINGQIIDLQKTATNFHIELPSDILTFLRQGEETLTKARSVETLVRENNQYSPSSAEVMSEITLLSPLPRPTSCRDGYAFRQHVAAARRNRGVEMIPEFDQFPVFYFTNHQAIFGPGDITLEKDHFEKFDFELEVAAVIGKQGKNIKAQDADSYIVGYTIMNDLSARVLQMEEMTLSLGPAKGKDFGTVLGPYLVTSDELESFCCNRDPVRGKSYDLSMKAFHNGRQVSEGNMKDMNYTFAEILERVSYGVDIYPGDVIGSGTVGTGCYLELNGTWAREHKEHQAKEGTPKSDFTPTWIKPGDSMFLEIAALGRLENRFLKTTTDYSILSKKKM